MGAAGSKQTTAITCCSEQFYNLGRHPLSPRLMATTVTYLIPLVTQSPADTDTLNTKLTQVPKVKKRKPKVL
jgi:hypothetical protein